MGELVTSALFRYERCKLRKADGCEADMPALINRDRSSAGPARPAAMPVTTNMPAPTIAPTPIAIASNKPSVFRSSMLMNRNLLIEKIFVAMTGAQRFIHQGAIL